MLQPRPALHPSDAAGVSTKASLSRRLMLPGIAGLILLGAVGLRFGSAAPEPDAVPAEEAERRASALGRLGSIALSPVAVGEIADAVRDLQLPPGDRERLQADAEAGRCRLVWLSLFDSDVEDGDVVEIQSSGFKHTVTLTKLPVLVAVPVPSLGRISLVGLVDGGGGGVTVGLVTQAGLLRLPPLSVGQTFMLPRLSP